MQENEGFDNRHGSVLSTMQLEQAMAGLKHGDTSLARNLIRKLTISSRPSVMTAQRIKT